MNDEIQTDELTLLKTKADRLGIQYHPSIGAEKLREKINAAMNEVSEVSVAVQPVVDEQEAKRNLMNEANKLIRVRITCMNPTKKDWEGELFTVSNSVVGTQKRYVPFNAPDGWHVPQMMLNMIQERQCQLFYTEKSKRGVSIPRSKLIKEFAIEILNPLTREELKDLAQQQAMANRVG